MTPSGTMAKFFNMRCQTEQIYIYLIIVGLTASGSLSGWGGGIKLNTLWCQLHWSTIKPKMLHIHSNLTKSFYCPNFVGPCRKRCHRIHHINLFHTLNLYFFCLNIHLVVIVTAIVPLMILLPSNICIQGHRSVLELKPSSTICYSTN